MLFRSSSVELAAIEPGSDAGDDSVARTVKVVFTPSGRRGSFPVNTPLLEAARSLGVDIDSVCGGRGLCGRCQIICTEGEFPKHQLVSHSSHLSPLSETERRYSERKKPLREGRRLSCHTLLLDDVVIDVPPDSQVHRQVVRKRAEVHEIELDPAVRVYYVEVQEPDMHDPASDLRRLKEALEFRSEEHTSESSHSSVSRMPSSA